MWNLVLVGIVMVTRIDGFKKVISHTHGEEVHPWLVVKVAKGEFPQDAVSLGIPAPPSNSRAGFCWPSRLATVLTRMLD